MPVSLSNSWCNLFRSTGYESLESRLVFSIDTLAGIADAALSVEPAVVAEMTPLTSGYEATGARYVMDEYGLDGSGQTVAIIDSGIAWDHYALGGGYGPGYRVVGGWDFAEGDANPYDDGPAGFHGTHVAGIVGSSEAGNRGVASGVDLVALRVFDDQGGGNLQWVEQALRWVHQHRSDFENPITTVNLSLGVAWNGNSLPGWATLEDEFAQLENDGIFISVAAGNAFQSYNSTGLAYPAVSSHVVPVASHGIDGSLSDFSQRNDRVIVAPGESIRSTVPDHLLGGTQSGAWLGASGTSMAAPFVAGASAVVREAMEFMGFQNITRQTLYDHFRQTADQFHDAVSGGNYYRLNLGRAIDAIINDLHGNIDDATETGLLTGHAQWTGTIGKLNDVDAFRFTAGMSGRLTFNVAQTHQLSSIVRVNGASLDFADGQASMQVVAGQSYTLSLSTGDGLGHYQIDVDLKPSVSATPLNLAEGHLAQTVSADGQQWFRLTAAHDGYLTASISGATGLQLEIRDSGMQLLAGKETGPGVLRGDATVVAGQEYYVGIRGNQSAVSLQIENRVGMQNGALRISGSAGDDHVGIMESDDGLNIQVTIDGTSYRFSNDLVRTIDVDATAGNDRLYLRCGAGSHQLTVAAGSVNMTGNGIQVAARGFESVHAVGGAHDQVTLLDSAGDDVFRYGAGAARMDSNGRQHIASGFGTVVARSESGHDQAYIAGSRGEDRVTSDGQTTLLRNAAESLTATGFASLKISGGGGSDELVLAARSSADFIELTGHNSRARLGGTLLTGVGFAKTGGATEGTGATARIVGTAESEYVWSSTSVTTISGASYENRLTGFETVVVDAGPGGGVDYVQVADSAGNDTVTATHHETRIHSTGLDRRFCGFDSATLVSRGHGYDSLSFSGSRGRDVVASRADAVSIVGARYRFEVRGFDAVVVDGGGGHDVADLAGGAGNDTMGFAAGQAQVSGSGFRVTVRDFERVRFDGGAGQNILNLGGFGEGDRLAAAGHGLVAWLDQQRIEAGNLIWLEASTNGDETAIHEINAVDFWYALHGNWQPAE